MYCCRTPLLQRRELKSNYFTSYSYECLMRIENRNNYIPMSGVVIAILPNRDVKYINSKTTVMVLTPHSKIFCPLPIGKQNVASVMRATVTAGTVTTARNTFGRRAIVTLNSTLTYGSVQHSYILTFRADVVLIICHSLLFISNSMSTAFSSGHKSSFKPSNTQEPSTSEHCCWSYGQ